jgi:hypothetical protein
MGQETRFDGPAEVIREAISPLLHGKFGFDSVAAPRRTVESGGFTAVSGFFIVLLLFLFGGPRGFGKTTGSTGKKVPDGL